MTNEECEEVLETYPWPERAWITAYTSMKEKEWRIKYAKSNQS